MAKNLLKNEQDLKQLPPELLDKVEELQRSVAETEKDLKNVADGKLLYFQDNIDSKFIDRIKELFPKKEIMRYDL